MVRSRPRLHQLWAVFLSRSHCGKHRRPVPHRRGLKEDSGATTASASAQNPVMSGVGDRSAMQSIFAGLSNRRKLKVPLTGPHSTRPSTTSTWDDDAHDAAAITTGKICTTKEKRREAMPMELRCSIKSEADDYLGSNLGQSSRKPVRVTTEGLPVYTSEQLGIGQGGGTPLCPFDCACCF